MREWIKDNKYLFFLCLLCILGLLIFVGHYSEILIDFGREVYYPEQILEGKVLYKDLFNIYGPLAYQLNALLFGLFGCKLQTLYFAGSICSVLLICGVYKLANKFLSKFLSFAIGIFTITVGVTTVSIFNFHFPYSWAILYGLTAFIYSLCFLIKYVYEQKPLYLCMSSFLAGLCIACKYDFLFYSIVILFFIIKNRDMKAFAAFFVMPLISYGVLFLQGLSFADLYNSLLVIKMMAKTKTLAYFYANSGIFYHPLAIPTDLLLFFKTMIGVGSICLGSLFKNKIASITMSVAGCFVSLLLLSDINRAFGFLPIFLLIFIAINFKKLSNAVRTLAVSVILVCLKVFWVLLIGSYGSFYVSMAIVAGCALLFNFLPKKLEKYFAIYVLIASAVLFLNNFKSLAHSLYPLKTDKGVIHTRINLGKSSDELIRFIENNTKTEDKIVIAPEGMTINFLTNRKSDDFYNSLLPLYFETFTQKTITEYYKKNLPEYVILTNHNTKDYYFEYICQDYAQEFCQFLQENYELRDVIDNGYRFVIFKSKS